jgi:hypothetical protein
MGLERPGWEGYVAGERPRAFGEYPKAFDEHPEVFGGTRRFR